MKNTSTNPTQTVLTIVLGFVFIYFTSDWKPAIYIAFCIGFLGLSSAYLAAKIDYLWMKLAWILSKIVPNILMTIIFYCILFPIALISRLFGEKDPLHLKNTSTSLFKETHKTFEKETFEKIW